MITKEDVLKKGWVDILMILHYHEDRNLLDSRLLGLGLGWQHKPQTVAFP